MSPSIFNDGNANVWNVNNDGNINYKTCLIIDVIGQNNI